MRLGFTVFAEGDGSEQVPGQSSSLLRQASMIVLFVGARIRLSLMLDLGRQADCTNSVLQLSLVMVTLVIND